MNSDIKMMKIAEVELWLKVAKATVAERCLVRISE